MTWAAPPPLSDIDAASRFGVEVEATGRLFTRGIYLRKLN